MSPARLLIPLAVATLIAVGCEAIPEETTANQRAAVFVDDEGGGHGPFACTGTIPPHGYADIHYYSGACDRVLGDFADDSGGTHLGYVFTTRDYAESIEVSPWVGANETIVQICPAGTVGTGCDPAYDHWVDTGGTFQTYGNFVNEVIIQYFAPCPYTPGMKNLKTCAGASTPVDASGYATVRIDDGFGNALKSSNGSSLDVNCFVHPADYGLSFTPPPGYARGWVAAVYDHCL